jgi:hypothetical protein
MAGWPLQVSLLFSYRFFSFYFYFDQYMPYAIIGMTYTYSTYSIYDYTRHRRQQLRMKIEKCSDRDELLSQKILMP